MATPHIYRTTLEWTGAEDGTTARYDSYSRRFEAKFDTKASIEGSADPHYRGDAAFVNPEDLLVVSIASCHMLTYLALCCRAQLKVKAYKDQAEGMMQMQNGKMRVTDVVLRPEVEFEGEFDEAAALALHEKAHQECFISNSVSCDIKVLPSIVSGA